MHCFVDQQLTQFETDPMFVRKPEEHHAKLKTNLATDKKRYTDVIVRKITQRCTYARIQFSFESGCATLRRSKLAKYDEHTALADVRTHMTTAQSMGDHSSALSILMGWVELLFNEVAGTDDKSDWIAFWFMRWPQSRFIRP